jgi:uncharacterized membrane protein YphA (DoxX/SURF4 family)
VLKQLWNTINKPHAQLCCFVLRIGLGTIFVWHGILKLVYDHGRGWSVDLPEFTQLAVAWGETVCGFALLAGLFSRLAALGVGVIMVGAILIQTQQFGFVHPPEAPPVGKTQRAVPVGTEYNFALIIMSLGVIALGSDPLALDHLIFVRRRRRLPAPTAGPATAVAGERPPVVEAAGLPGEG